VAKMDVIGDAATRHIATGKGWSVDLLHCRLGPRDRPFAEQRARFSVALTLEGCFTHRTPAGAALIPPGSFLLGNAGEEYLCSHEREGGDRCLCFSFDEEAFPGSHDGVCFRSPRLPMLRKLSPLTTEIVRVLRNGEQSPMQWEELGTRAAAAALALDVGWREADASPADRRRVSETLRRLEEHPDENHTLSSMAAEVCLSRHGFLRLFERVSGLTPHQFLLRLRLRNAAVLLAEGCGVLETAMRCGFADLANFHRNFRREFGRTPAQYAGRRSQKSANNSL